MRAVILAALAVAALAAPDPTIVQTDTGTVRGVVGTKSRSFLGIPFAAPPVDELRWQPPQPPQNWSGVLNATWYGPSCYQNSNAFTFLSTVSEDCLYLNVYTPYPMPTSKTIPVMLWFYGGSWENGSASFLLYNPDTDISLVEDVIVVTVNYRLNVFGFLASTALRNQDPDGSTGNYGLQDQRAAMQWVQRNIAAFGGNPDIVTIFGESAGAGSVSNHLVSPKSQGLFHRAIAESGPFADWTAQTFNESVIKYIEIAQELGCCTTACADNDPAIVACLRTFNSSMLETAGRNAKAGFLTWSPVIDGVEVIDDPRVLVAAGKIANVPTLYGTNADEGTKFNHCPTDLPAANYSDFLTQTYGATLADEVVTEYPVSDYQNAFWASSRALGDSQMGCPARWTARAIASARANDTNAAPMYLYYLNSTLTVIDLFVPNTGVCHGIELAFVFDLTIALWTPEEVKLAQTFVKLWTSFAATGVPVAPGLPEWPAFTMDTQLVATLDTQSFISPTANWKTGVCDFWDNHPVPSSLIWG